MASATLQLTSCKMVVMIQLSVSQNSDGMKSNEVMKSET